MQGTKTLYEYLRELAELSPDKRILGDDSRWLTALETLSLSEHLAARLTAAGIRSGDHVALRAHRSLFTCIALFGLRAIGAVVALTDPRHRPTAFLSDSLLPIPVSATVEQTGDSVFRVATAEGRTEFDLFALSPARLKQPFRDPNGPAFLIFTSGSTGAKKAVVLSEAGMISCLVDTEPLGYYSKEDIALGALPIDHVFGLALLFGVVTLGYAMYLPAGTDVPSLLSAIERERLTRMNGVPSLYLAMCEHAAEYDLSSLRAGLIAGSPVTPERFGYIEDVLGITLISVYGMSESVGISCSSYKDPRRVRAGGVGPFYPMNTGAIFREDGSRADPFEEGEICVKGPMRMLGYFGQPLGRDEWLRTGDLGFLDHNGVLHLTGRKKDIIIRNGINLSPIHIENVLAELPGVKAAAVVGLSDDREGEVPAAMVVSDRGADEILVDAAERLNKNEIPVLLRTADALPMTASGKTDRPRVREALNGWRNG